MTVALCILGWLVCGFVSSGFSYAYWQREFPEIADKGRGDDAAVARFELVFGLIGLVMTFIHKSPMGNRWYCHGWLFPGRKP